MDKQPTQKLRSGQKKKKFLKKEGKLMIGISRFSVAHDCVIYMISFQERLIRQNHSCLANIMCTIKENGISFLSLIIYTKQSAVVYLMIYTKQTNTKPSKVPERTRLKQSLLGCTHFMGIPSFSRGTE